MSESDPLRILMVEDAPGVARGLMSLIDDLEESTQRDVKFRHVASVGMLKQAIAGGEQWDIALVDLDLGVAQESGLAAMDALSDTSSPPGIILWTEAYDVSRTLGLVAASAWFDIKATYNKIGGFSL